MRKGSSVIGKTVVTYDTGERVARIQDLIFDQNSNRLLGFLVEEGGLLGSAKVISIDQVEAIGASAIIVSSQKAIARAKKIPEIKSVLAHNNVLKGTRILTVHGRDLGTMVDLYFDDQTGVVEGYEVSGGLFADAYSGRSFVPAPQTLRIGEHVAFVPIETASLMDEQLGGIKGAMQTTGKSLQETTELTTRKLQVVAQITQDKFQETAESANKTLQEATQIAMSSLTSAVVDPVEQSAFVIGKTANRDVVAPSGTLLVAEGQLITFEIQQEAEQLGILSQLYRAAGGSAVAEVNRKLQETTDLLQQKLQDVTRLASDKLQSGTEIAVENLQEATRHAAIALTDSIVDPAEQKMLIIGKTVDREVVTAEGRLLAAKGEPVTEQMAEAAEQQGVLDLLFRAAGGSLAAELTRSANSILASRIVEQALGRRVHHTVQTREGLVIAAPGQIVTAHVIERARLHQQEQDLLVAVGLTPGEAIRSNANVALSTTGEQLRGGISHLEGTAESLLEVLKARFTTLQHKLAQIVEERQIKRALGRPVMRVILDQDDSIILNVGEMVTHQAIAHARQADVLDVLLNAIYIKRPELPLNNLGLSRQNDSPSTVTVQVSNEGSA